MPRFLVAAAAAIALASAPAYAEAPAKSKFIDGLMRRARLSAKFDRLDIRVNFRFTKPGAKLALVKAGQRSEIAIDADGHFDLPNFNLEELNEMEAVREPADSTIEVNIDFLFKVPAAPFAYQDLVAAGHQLDQLFEEEAGWKAHFVPNISKVEVEFGAGSAACALVLRDSAGGESRIESQDKKPAILEFSSALAKSNPMISATCPITKLDPH